MPNRVSILAPEELGASYLLLDVTCGVMRHGNQKLAGYGGVSGNVPMGRFPTSTSACGDGSVEPDGVD